MSENKRTLAAGGAVADRNNPPDALAEVTARLNAWRAKALSIVMTLLVALALPALLLVLFSRQLQWPWLTRGASVALFLVLVAATWRRDCSLPLRALIFFGVAYGSTALRLTTSGLAGSGRTGLMLFPILALILVGPRAGWVAAGVSVALFAGFTTLAATGWLAGKLMVRENSTDLAFWLLQGLMVLVGLIPLLVLLSRFQALQIKIMLKERGARQAVEAAAAEHRRLEGEITRVSEEEQRRVGSELHDGLCQQLTAALLTCTAIEKDLAAHQAPQSAATHRLRALLETCIGSAYDAAKGLCPLDMDSESLAPALQRLARQVEEKSGAACQLRAEGEALLDHQTTFHLYRIAQEAVHNAVKHARCRRILLELRGSDEACVLQVSDDGQPAPQALPSRPGGLGRQIMNYRAKMIGGALQIEHPPGGGTVVKCRVPCCPSQSLPAQS